MGTKLTYRRIEIWTLRVGLVLLWLGIESNHHSWVSTIGIGLVVISIVVGLVGFVRRRRFRSDT